MNDPAIEAARRAYVARNGNLGVLMIDVAVAREALNPLRGLHSPFKRDYPGGDGRVVCNHCLGPVDWPCSTARLVYAEDELAQETK
jgi:hypothetical protein